MTTLIAAIAVLAATETPVIFDRQRIGDTTFEAAGIFDVNQDGALDIVSGEYWYVGPVFEERHFIADVMPYNDYYDDFSDYPMDVNGDGYPDIVTGAWWSQTLRWRENPKGNTTEWKTHDVAQIGNIERIVFYDINGDGYEEVIPNTPGKPQQIFKLIRDEDGKGTGEFTRRTISNMPTGHGLGLGDINHDGRPDVVLQNGWFENPAKPFEEEWAWHPSFQLAPSASVPILVHDVNEDGLNDIIVGHGHDYGLEWHEQGEADGETTWTKHMIETDRSQFHEMQLADIDNDGAPELITGKRYYAHSGNDPGAEDPLGLYYYEINGGDFERVTIDYGPATSASGTGLMMAIKDINDDGWLDILAPGKEGMYLFISKSHEKQ